MGWSLSIAPVTMIAPLMRTPRLVPRSHISKQNSHVWLRAIYNPSGCVSSRALCHTRDLTPYNDMERHACQSIFFLAAHLTTRRKGAALHSRNRGAGRSSHPSPEIYPACFFRRDV